MTKKVFSFLVLVILITKSIFAQNEEATKSVKLHKHEAFDILLGVGASADFGIFRSGGENNNSIRSQMDLKLGVNCDFYVFPWFSSSAGLIFGLFQSTYTKDVQPVISVTAASHYLTILYSAHFNIPNYEWLYTGLGVGFNIIKDEAYFGTGKHLDHYYTSLPIDLGFDFAKPSKRAGGRLFFRVTPNFYTLNIIDGGTKIKTITTFGLAWQSYNWKIS
jgi:hypothetical protein